MPEREPWHEQDAFWETFEPVLFSRQRKSDAPAQVEKIIALLGIRPGAAVLDLCCGIGRHALELARCGFHVTGVDRTRAYLNKAAEQANAAGLEMEFVQEDMRTFCRPDTFDVVVSLFTSFGYFKDAEEDRHTAVNVHRSLKAGGAFLLEMMGKEVLARSFQERVWQEEDGVLLLQECKVSNSWSWVEHRWIVVKSSHRHELRFSHRLYSAAELTSLLVGCGFTRTEVYGDLEGAPYDHMAKRLVIVARK
jgi:SAM-dependent methyltransferase